MTRKLAVAYICSIFKLITPNFYLVGIMLPVQFRPLLCSEHGDDPL